MGFNLGFKGLIPHNFSNLVILHLPAYEDGTECSETSAYKYRIDVCRVTRGAHIEHRPGIQS